MIKKMNDKLAYGLIGTLLLLVGFGGSQLLTQGQLDNAYVCTTNENVAIFQRLSSTMKTGYYLDEDGVEQSIVCRNGFWVSLKEYATSKGVTIDSLLQKSLLISDSNYTTQWKNVVQYRCSNQGCEVIK